MEIEVKNTIEVANRHERQVAITAVRAILEHFRSNNEGEFNPVVQQAIAQELNGWSRDRLIECMAEQYSQKILRAVMDELKVHILKGEDHITLLEAGLQRMEEKHAAMKD